VSKDASDSGWPLVAHAADCRECDARVALVTAKNHKQGGWRPVHGISHSFPRSQTARAGIYSPGAAPLGQIPEGNETVAYWEAVYGLINEHGVSIGESLARINRGGVDLPDKVWRCFRSLN